jgi:hypothetical protein
LTREIDRPGIGELDTYLKPFVGPAVSRDETATALTKLRGLAGAVDPDSNNTGKRKR